jgi:hypothetical protein
MPSKNPIPIDGIFQGARKKGMHPASFFAATDEKKALAGRSEGVAISLDQASANFFKR